MLIGLLCKLAYKQCILIESIYCAVLFTQADGVAADGVGEAAKRLKHRGVLWCLAKKSEVAGIAYNKVMTLDAFLVAIRKFED